MTQPERDTLDRDRLARIAAPPAHRRDRRGNTRTALLDAAERLWAERGIRGASLDDIAAAAGLTKGAVYSNFAGKIDMLFALFERHAQRQSRSTVGWCLRESERSLEDRLEQEYERKLGSEEARLMALLKVEFWLYGMRDFSAGWRVADWYDTRRNRLAEMLVEKLTETDEMSALDRATLAMAIDTGLMFQHMLDPERVPARLYASGLRLVLTGSSPSQDR
jgi:AcrR family transcriptional regulator